MNAHEAGEIVKPAMGLGFMGHTTVCGQCGARNKIVNECRCDPNNLPTRPVKSIGWSYPTSPNAGRLGFAKTGCWSVHVGELGEPAVAIAGYQKREEAMAHAQSLSEPWDPVFLRFNPIAT